MQTEIALPARKRLRLAREAARMDQLAMANLLGVTRSAVSQYENGHTEPTLSALVKWADAADVSLDWLCARRDSNPQPSDLYLAGERGDHWHIDCPTCEPTRHCPGHPECNLDALDVELQLLVIAEGVIL